MSNVLIGHEEFYPTYSHRTDVYRATHRMPVSLSETDWLRKSFMERSFISFSYGGKWIEDFNLLATIEGDRLQRQSSANFEHLTTTYDVLDGQFYWGTHYTDNTINFVLATDGMTQEDIDNFKYWFRAGSIRELILAEHPNRAIMARVSAPAGISVLPFEQDTDVQIIGKTYYTKTTLYKGSITLSFSMDEPFWYSKYRMLWKDNESANTEYQGIRWINANNREVEPVNDMDALKIIKEDGIPVRGMLSTPVILGYEIIDSKDFSITGETDGLNLVTRDDPVLYNGIAVAAASNKNDTIDEAVGIVTMESEQVGADLSNSKPLYLYYPGTAPCKPTIKFSFTPTLKDGYIILPKNKYSDGSTYNVITFTSVNTKNFQFSLPSAFVGYNQAINIFKTVPNGTSFVEIRKLLRDNVVHKHARAWAIAVTDDFEDSDVINATKRTTACKNMEYFLRNNEPDENNKYNILKSSFEFNCKTGHSTGLLNYRVLLNEETETNEDEEQETPASIIWAQYGAVNIVREDVGDMVKSEYLTLEDRNYPSKDGYILPYNEENEITQSYTYKITSDMALSNFTLEYDYMYI